MRRLFASLMCLFIAAGAGAQQKVLPVTLQVADATIKRWPEGHIGAKNEQPLWGFEPGIVLAGMSAVWEATKDPRYLAYIKQTVDQWVQQDGSIKTYDAKTSSLNNILIGRQLLLLDRITHENKYRIAAATLRKQLATQPRTPSGGMWHTQATRNLMLLDDQFMFAPFYAEYAKTFNQPSNLDDVTKQFSLLNANTRNPRNGLLYHGWDESRQAPWANKKTGTSPNLWARGLGWYLMALVDTLQCLDADDVHRSTLLEIFRQTSAAVERTQDHNSNLWYQILDKPGLPGNYIESSSVLMFTYAFEKGARLGYLPARYHGDAERAWVAIQKCFVQVDSRGQITLTGTVTHISMGASPENDGSDSYYLNAPVVSDDPKGVGAFLLAGSEMELQHHK